MLDNLICSRCGDEIAKPGALVFSPPLGGIDREWLTEKFHICVACWADVKKFISP